MIILGYPVTTGLRLLINLDLQLFIESVAAGHEKTELSMTRDQIKDAIVEIINDILPDGDCSQVNPDEKLRDQLDLDSMDFLDIVMELRKQYKVQIPEEDYPKLASLSSCIEYLEPRMKSL